MNRIYIYCDGGCRGNQYEQNIGGYGVIIEHPKYTKEFYGAKKNTTNNRMELIACIEALRKLKVSTLPILVTSDSKYVVLGINKWHKAWLKRGWTTATGKPIGNQDLWKELLYLKDKHKNITFKHCRGHSTNKGNIRADFLANVAMDDYLTNKSHIKHVL